MLNVGAKVRMKESATIPWSYWGKVGVVDCVTQCGEVEPIVTYLIKFDYSAGFVTCTIDDLEVGFLDESKG